MTRIVGPTGSRRRRRFLVVPILLTTLVALFLTVGAQAVHDATDDFFELGPGPATDEGGLTNILGTGTTSAVPPAPNGAGPDWADLFTGTCANGTCAFKDTDGDAIPDWREVFGGHAAGFIQDESSAASGTDSTTFSGFGTSNKNNDAISTADCENRDPPLTGSDCAPWGWDDGNVPPKDDLSNVYSYEVIDPANNHLLLYAGVERADPSGDSHIDIEYFQDQVGLVENSTAFSGVRTVNDVIVSMDFVRGGGIGSVSIRRWNGDEYEPVGDAGGQGCFASPPPASVPDTICAFNNGGDIDGGLWPNIDSHGDVITELETNAFTEIGVDLTALIGASPCISTFMGKTRSSASFTAELKDFAGPQQFDVCQPSTDLSASASATTIHSGSSVTLTFTETNDGNETLVTPSVTTDSTACNANLAGVDADIDGFNDGDTDEDGKLDPGETWLFKCTITNVTADVTVTATASGVGELSGKTVTACADPDDPPPNTVCDEDEQVSVSIDVINPGTELVKKASVTVTYRYEETNDGDVALDSPSVSDNNCSPVVGVDADNDTFNDGDSDKDGKLDPLSGATPAETWLFSCSRAASTLGADVDVTNVAVGSGTDPVGSNVTFCTGTPPTNTVCDEEERDRVRVQVTHLPGGAG